MEDKDIFDWVGFIGGVYGIMTAILDGIIEKIKKIYQLDKKGKTSAERKFRKLNAKLRRK